MTILKNGADDVVDFKVFTKCIKLKSDIIHKLTK